jgi:hypothetical protein
MGEFPVFRPAYPAAGLPVRRCPAALAGDGVLGNILLTDAAAGAVEAVKAVSLAKGVVLILNRCL